MTPLPRLPQLWFVLVMVLWGNGCHSKTAAPAPAARASASAMSSAGELDLRREPEGPPLELGPDASLPLSARQQRMAELLQGVTAAARFPLVDFNPDSAYGEGQLGRLTTVPLDQDAAPPKVLPARVFVKVETPVVLAGTPDVHNLQRVVAGMRAGFRNCYERFAALHPEEPVPTSQPSLVVSVGLDGSVTKTAWERAPASESVGQCVQARVMAARFGAQRQGWRFRCVLQSRPAE